MARKTLVIALSIVVLVVFGLFGNILTVVVTIPYNPTTQQSMCRPGRNVDGGSVEPPFVNSFGTGNYPGNELLDASVYWMSWLPGGQSQTVAVQGRFASCLNSNRWPDFMDKTKYVFSIKTSIVGGWDMFKNKDNPSGAVAFDNNNLAATANLQGWVFKIYGQSYTGADGVEKSIPDGSILRAEMFFEEENVWYGPMARDEAQLRSAIPDGYFSNTRNSLNLYQVGDEFQFHWSLPTTEMDSINAYALTITNENDATPIAGWDSKALTTKTGLASFLITESMFSSDLADSNTIRVVITGMIVVGFQGWTAVIDNATKAPVLVSVEADSDSYHMGDLVTVTVVGSPNAITALPLVKAILHADINGPSVFDGTATTPVQDGDRYTFTFQFTASFAGILTVSASVFDTANRPSGYLPVQILVGEKIPDKCTLYPDLAVCQIGTAAGIWMIAMIVGFILLLVGLMWKSLPFPFRILFILVGTLLLFLGFIFWVLPSVTNYIKDFKWL